MTKIARFYLILFYGCLLLTAGAFAKEDTRKVTPPKKIEYDDMLLTYNPAWQDEETYLEANLDADPEPEIIISFVADYKTEPKKKKEDIKPFQQEKQELLPVYNYVFYEIYDQGPDKTYRLIKTINGLDRPGHVQLLTLEKGRPPAILLVSPGGTHYKDIQVLQWQEGGYRSIFSQGTRDDVHVIDDPSGICLVLGAQSYRWNNAKQTFERDAQNTPPADPIK